MASRPGELPPRARARHRDAHGVLGATQAQQWDKLVGLLGRRPRHRAAPFAERLAKEIDDRGAVDVLRHGVKDRGLLFRLAYFRPAHTLADDALVQYEENRLSVTRQLHYSTREPDRSLDLVLFVNGIPVATAELKNPFTGQTVEHAKEQYRRDRDPRELLFARRRWSISRSTRSWSSSRRDSPGRRPGSCRSTPGRTARGSTVAPATRRPGPAGTGRRTCGSRSGSRTPGSTSSRFVHVENAEGDGRRSPCTTSR